MKAALIGINIKCGIVEFIEKLGESGYFLHFIYNGLTADGIKTVMPALKNCDVIFVVGDKKRFCDMFSVAETEDSYFKINSFLYIYLKDTKAISNIGDIVREYNSDFSVNMSVYRIFLEQGRAPDFDGLGDFGKMDIQDKFLISSHRTGCFLDLTVRHRSDSRTAQINKMILENYFNYVYATSFLSLSEVVSSLLIKNNIKLKIAESFTGGKIASKLTAIAGASNFLSEAVVAYSYSAKQNRLGVNSATIEKYGAVSRETAYEMAKNLLKSGECDIAISTTGNAGPTVQNGEAGRCFISVASNSKIEVFDYTFDGDRTAVIDSGVNHTLFLLYRRLMLSYNRV